jgi:hypothetical protein
MTTTNTDEFDQYGLVCESGDMLHPGDSPHEVDHPRRLDLGWADNNDGDAGDTLNGRPGV